MKKILFFGEYGWTTLCINFCIILKKLISYRAVVYNAGLLEQQINNCTMAHGQKSFHSVYRLHIHGHVIHGQKSFNSIYRLHGVPTAFIWNECITLSVRRKMPYFSRPAYTNLWCRAKTCRVKLKRCSVKTLCVVICGDLLVRRDNKQLCQPCQSFQH